MYCEQCGTLAADGSRFCSNCGFGPFTPKAPPPPPAPSVGPPREGSVVGVGTLSPRAPRSPPGYVSGTFVRRMSSLDGQRAAGAIQEHRSAAKRWGVTAILLGLLAATLSFAGIAGVDGLLGLFALLAGVMGAVEGAMARGLTKRIRSALALRRVHESTGVVIPVDKRRGFSIGGVRFDWRLSANGAPLRSHNLKRAAGSAAFAELGKLVPGAQATVRFMDLDTPLWSTRGSSKSRSDPTPHHARSPPTPPGTASGTGRERSALLLEVNHVGLDVPQYAVIEGLT